MRTPEGGEPDDILTEVVATDRRVRRRRPMDFRSGSASPAIVHARSHHVGRERLEEVDRARGRGAVREGARTRHPLRQRRGCRRVRRGALRRGEGRRRARDPHDARHRDRISAFIYDGVLVPNTELGHLEIDGRDAEIARVVLRRRSASRSSWKEWATRLQRYYSHVEFTLLARPLHRRRRRLEAPRGVPAAAQPATADRPGVHCATTRASSARRHSPYTSDSGPLRAFIAFR